MNIRIELAPFRTLPERGAPLGNPTNEQGVLQAELPAQAPVPRSIFVSLISKLLFSERV
jgi:hypothetical protein